VFNEKLHLNLGGVAHQQLGDVAADVDGGPGERRPHQGAQSLYIISFLTLSLSQVFLVHLILPELKNSGRSQTKQFCYDRYAPTK